MRLWLRDIEFPFSFISKVIEIAYQINEAYIIFNLECESG